MDSWLSWISGYKTYLVGGAMVIVGSIGMVVHFIDPTSVVQMEPDAAKGLILLGLGMFGIGHKLDKARDAAIQTANNTLQTASATQQTAVATANIAGTNEDIANSSDKMATEITKPV